MSTLAIISGNSVMTDTMLGGSYEKQHSGGTPIRAPVLQNNEDPTETVHTNAFLHLYICQTEAIEVNLHSYKRYFASGVAATQLSAKFL